MFLRLFTVFLAFLSLVNATNISPCLEKCIEPMTKMEKTISYLYRHYEDVCEVLEKSAICSQKCSNQDHTLFFQYTTFYRVHCIEMNEPLEDHLQCLSEASYKADFICREQCKPKQDKTANKEEKQKQLCKTVECSTICYFKQFSQSCPNSIDILIKTNVRNADEMRRLTSEDHMDKMNDQCRKIHDGAYIKKQLIEALKNEL